MKDNLYVFGGDKVRESDKWRGHDDRYREIKFEDDSEEEREEKEDDSEEDNEEKKSSPPMQDMFVLNLSKELFFFS